MNQEQPAKFAFIGLVIAGVIGGAIVNHFKGSESAAVAMASPPTFNSTAVGAVAGGLGTGILGLTGVLGWITRLIGFGKSVKDVAGVQKLIDDISAMIKAGKVDVKLLIADAVGVDSWALLRLLNSLISLSGKTAVMSGGGELPMSLQSVAGTPGESNVVVIEF